MPTATVAPLVLRAERARELMTANPISISQNAPLREALVLFAEKGFSAAPVIDKSGRPVGVLSQSDIIIHDREKVTYLAEAPEYYYRSHLATREGERLEDFQVEKADQTPVRDLMTPAVFSVKADTPSAQVIEQMLALRVHRLFVVDDDNTLVGVISALDVLRRLTAR